MKIYLDYIFLENLVINVIIYLATINLISRKININKIIIFSIINSLSFCICTILNLNNYLVIFFVNFFIILFSIKDKKIINVLKCTIVYYLTYYIYIGLIIYFSIILNLNLNYFIIKIILYLFCGIILNICINNLWKMWKIKLSNKYLFYDLKMNNILIPVFVDTGNSVKDVISNLDVIFINSNYKDKIINFENTKRKILVSSVNNVSFVEGYVINNVSIYKEHKKVATIKKIIVSFDFNNTQEKYSGILGYEIYLKYLEGVSIC